MRIQARFLRSLALFVLLASAPSWHAVAHGDALAPAPRVSLSQAVDWLFVFKFNAAIFPSSASDHRPCPFGGDKAQPYARFSQRYAFATSDSPTLVDGPGLAGTSNDDPLGATFSEIWSSSLHYVIWNDQFYLHPKIAGCSKSCGAPWAHSKGILVWDETGNGMVLQVTTPSWPAAAHAAHPRADDGNTLGCVEDNDVKASQDFFALRLTEPDVENVLDALANASVVTDINNPQLVENGGPQAIRERVARLGVKSRSVAPLAFTLSTGVRLISKPSALHVPPWQMVSALLGGVDLRTATWWMTPAIPGTARTSPIVCWADGLGAPGAVQIATSGSWNGRTIGLRGGPFPDANHGKIGVSISGDHSLTILGDMNQQGALSGNCASSQNGRGGLFFVVENPDLNRSVSGLIEGDSGPVAGGAIP
jgi:hypothetical protein